jgi:hypothetical protein
VGVSVNLGAGGCCGCGVVGCGVCVLRVGILALLGILLGFGWVEVDAASEGGLLVVLFVSMLSDKGCR